MCLITSVLTPTNLEMLVFTWMLLRCVQRKVRTRVVTSTNIRAGKRRIGRRRKRNAAMMMKIQINLWLFVTKLKNWSRACVERSLRFGWRKMTQWLVMSKQLIQMCESWGNQRETDIQVKGITCEINRVERLRFDNLANLTGPDPKRLGASPTTQFLTANGPQERTYILDMLPDTGAGVTLISEKVAKERRMEINRNESHMYKIHNAS